jgi:hypothetical protein
VLDALLSRLDAELAVAVLTNLELIWESCRMVEGLVSRPEAV